MRILILGGTVFVGRALVRAAQQQGHEVTILSRGRSGPDPEGVRVLRGDRDRPDGLQSLGDETFDAVVDTSSHFVSRVRAAVQELRERTGRYVFISTVSVYRDFSELGVTEESPTYEPVWSQEQEQDLANYGGLNVACEQVVRDAMAEQALVVRPGLVVGDHDSSDRFGYWPARMVREGTVLAPGTPERPVQLIDVHDLADFVVRAMSAGRSGVYNAVGPRERLTMGELLRACHQHLGSRAELEWVDDGFLMQRGVQPFLDLPLWIPDEPEDVGFSAVDGSRAVAAGLTHRPLGDTIEAALRTERRLGLDRERRAGLNPDRERALLEEWRAR